MSEILKIYNANLSAPGVQADVLDAKAKAMDATPYSLGNGFAGKKDIDEDGLKAVELKNAKGNRYGSGVFGGGYPNAKGYTDKNKYSDIPKK